MRADYCAWLDANPSRASVTPGREQAGKRLLAGWSTAPLILSAANCSDRAARRHRRHRPLARPQCRQGQDGSAADRLERRLSPPVCCCPKAARAGCWRGGSGRALGELSLRRWRRPVAQPAGADGCDGAAGRSAGLLRAPDRDPPAALDTMLAMLVPPLLRCCTAMAGWATGRARARHRPTDRRAGRASGVRARPLQGRAPMGLPAGPPGEIGAAFRRRAAAAAAHARSGCASTLAFELSQGEPDHRQLRRRRAGGRQVPRRIEQGLRATAAHSTLVLDDANSTAVLIKGKLGSGVERSRSRPRADDKQGAATRLEASHDGYAARFGLIHRRMLVLRDDGSELRGEDVLIPAGKKRQARQDRFRDPLPYRPGIELRSVRRQARCGPCAARWQLWQFRWRRAAKLSIEESLWVDGMGARSRSSNW